jgi:hypothetical protein
MGTVLRTSQYYAYYLPVDHIFFTGTRGPGKTDTQLMRFRRKVGLGYGHFWKGVIFDREYKNLGDIIGKSKRWFPQFNDGAEFKESTSALKWVWPTGEELLFRTVKRVDDYWAYHGHEYAFIGWNELCKYPTPDLYQKMMSVNRTSFVPEADTPTEPLYIRVKIKDKVTGKEEIKLWCVHDRDKGILLPKIPLEVFSTGNPYGPGHNWVKRKFITPAPFGEVVRTRAMVFNPATQVEEEVTKTPNCLAWQLEGKPQAIARVYPRANAKHE